MPVPADQRVVRALHAASVSLQFAFEDARDAGDHAMPRVVALDHTSRVLRDLRALRGDHKRRQRMPVIDVEAGS